MKKLQMPGVLLLAFALLFSCEKDEDNEITPEISQVGAENHDTGENSIAIGGTISVNFEARTRSEAKLDYYHIEIHDHPVSGNVEDEYKIIDDDFKNEITFKGLVNAHVHEHIRVPDAANTGPYHVVVIVVDEEGNSANTEDLDTHVEITE